MTPYNKETAYALGLPMLNTIKRLMDRHINYPMALLSAVFLGFTVFLINLPHGASMALVAATKQATYTFFAAGIITRNSENLALRFSQPQLSLLFSIVLSTCIAVGLTYLVHSLRGTAEPLQSTIPTLVTAPLAFLIVGVQAQRRAKQANASRHPPTEHQ